jgi:hypothetical protein
MRFASVSTCRRLESSRAQFARFTVEESESRARRISLIGHLERAASIDAHRSRWRVTARQRHRAADAGTSRDVIATTRRHRIAATPRAATRRENRLQPEAANRASG